MITFVSERKHIKRNLDLSELADSIEDIISNPMSDGIVKILNERFGETKCTDHPDFNLFVTLTTELSASGSAQFNFESGPVCCEAFKSKAEDLIRSVKFE